MDCSGNGRERACGLFLFWKEKVRVNIISFSLNHISGPVVGECDGQD